MADDRTRPPIEDDLVLRALRGLPDLAPRAPREARIHARATAELLAVSARHRRASARVLSVAAAGRALAGIARPILPFSIAGFALGYLVWAVHTAATYLP
jgi:hypothetical protein